MNSFKVIIKNNAHLILEFSMKRGIMNAPGF